MLLSLYILINHIQLIMKKLHVTLWITLLGFVVLTSCDTDSSVKERLRALENRVATLENKSSVNTPAALQVNQSEEASQPNPNAPKFQFAVSTHDFGNIKEGDVVEHTFKFKNTGKSPLVIQSARASCGCTVPSYPNEPLAPGEEGEILVKFDSRNKPGIQNKTVTITANTEPATTQLYIKSNVLPKDDSAGPVKK